MTPDTPSRPTAPTPRKRIAAGRIVLIYAAFAALWIAVSDRVLTAEVSDLGLVAVLATLKGWLFVAVTSIMVYGMIKLNEARLRQAEEQRGRTEQALHETDAQMRWLSDNLPGSYIYQYSAGDNGGSRFLYVSAEVERVHGVRPALMLEDHRLLNRQLSPDDRVRLQEAEAQSVREMMDLNVTFPFTRPDGSRRWVNLRSRPRRSTGGNVIWDGIGTDVTELKGVETALRLSELKYSLAFSNNTAAIALTALADGRVLEVNDTWVSLVGYGREEILGRTVRHVWPDDGSASRFVKELRDKGVLRGWEQAFRKKSGETFTAEISAQVLQINGEDCILSTVVDVSARKQAEQARVVQQRRMALLADISGRLVLSETSGDILEGIFSDLARELKIDIFANYMVSPAGDRLILESAGGLTPDQRVAFSELSFGVSLCGLVARDRQPRIYADLANVAEPQAAGIIALGVRAYAGFPLVAGGRIIGTVSFGSRSRTSFPDEDLRLMKAVADQVAAAVERSRLFDALKDGEERFREVVENIQEVFWLSDVAKEKALYVSPGFATIWGRSCESVVESMSVWTDSIHPEDRARVIDAARTRQMLGTYHETYRILRPDGSLRWVRDRAFPIKDASGKVSRIVGVAEDITQQREMESRFLRSQRLEAVGTLAGGVAHDLNNILAPVLMISGLLKENHPQPAEQKMLDMLESSAKRGAGIVRQLLAFSRGATGEMGVVQLRHLAHEMCTLMKETFPRDIAIVDSFPPELWLVLGDGTQLHQVFMNLCVNARDAMPEGGKLTFRGTNVDLSAEDAARHPGARAGHYVCIAFEDTGSGIPPEIIDRIFDPFFTTKEMGKGTGLGLSTVLGIVKSHQGFITLTSVIGQGTSFQVYLPATDGCPASAAAASAAPSARGQGELIIVVDDEDTVRASTRLILERNNYRVAVAGDGREAVARFLENQDAVRLVLTDLMMPVMGGVALARSLHNLRPDLPIIATTGLEEQSKQAELRQLGVRDILVKPYTAPELLTLVRQRLDRG